ncbi:HD domain-containing phosphohydrolase [Vibrio sp. LaRot3]|uniref:HD domain-containing phosphohydrolase n=1 Tax=Vibrio sp. LaRot3 TaxID=2998829 RepID=UPI0022CE1488|nr:HD domain-containing phosphohydrolase [Vibrio sp. LaRot3]MDA0148494.1 HD domain-containing protein [Vibrio sp. LaRot3]
MRSTILLIALLLTSSFFVQAKDWQTRNVLVLHSYSPSYQWTADFQKGIDQAIKKSNYQFKLSIEYLDTKRIFHEQYFAEFVKYFDAKYQGYEFDAVLVTDDNALKLLKQWPNNPLRGLPIIAAGINDHQATLADVSDRTHIIYEQDEIEKTIRLIKDLRPKLKKLYYLADRSVTSELVRNKANVYFAQQPELEIVEVRDIPLNELGKVLGDIDPNDAVLLTHFNTDLDEGIYHSYQHIAERVASSSAAPVFVFWEFYIREGVLGGHVNRSEQIGRQMVLALDNFLPLDLTSEITVGNAARPVVDHNVMTRFGMSDSLLPPETLILNEPSNFIKQNWQVFSVAFIIIICLSLVIVTQAIVIRHKRELNLKNKRIVQLQGRTLQTQKDVIVVLGEAIETRSGETGNHVKRVAKLSSMLAKLNGSTHREVELLEIVSPMHDVGKIAIPESILDKPGKLDPQEWEIMKTHTTHGYNLLSASKGDVFSLAATIANEHHEHWNGKGYPQGLVGEEIHIFARITAIADVFDALLSVRCYKQAWSLDEVIALLEREKGEQFDPHLTQLLLDNLDTFVEIRNTYPDKPTNKTR